MDGKKGGGSGCGGGGGGGRVYTYRYTVITRTTLALRWAAMTAGVYCFINCEGQSYKDSVHRPDNLCEEKGEPKRIRTEALLLLSSLT